MTLGRSWGTAVAGLGVGLTLTATCLLMWAPTALAAPLISCFRGRLLRAPGMGDLHLIWYSEILWHRSEPKRDPRNSLQR